MQCFLSFVHRVRKIQSELGVQILADFEESFANQGSRVSTNSIISLYRPAPCSDIGRGEGGGGGGATHCSQTIAAPNCIVCSNQGRYSEHSFISKILLS